MKKTKNIKIKFEINQEKKREEEKNIISQDQSLKTKNNNNNNKFNNKYKKTKLNNKKININFLINFKRSFISMRFFIILSLVSIFSIIGICNKQNNFLKMSEITLKIMGKDAFTILPFEFFSAFLPDKIYVNNLFLESKEHEYKFNFSVYHLYTFIIK